MDYLLTDGTGAEIKRDDCPKKLRQWAIDQKLESWKIFQCYESKLNNPIKKTA